MSGKDEKKKEIENNGKKGKKYYFIKLEDDFYRSDKIRYIEAQENGIFYSNIYVKLILLSVADNGYVTDGGEPYDIGYLAFVLGHSVETLTAALEFFEKNRLIQRTEDGAFYITDFCRYVGVIGEEAMKKRRQKERLAIETAEKKEPDTDSEKDSTDTLPVHYPDSTASLPGDYTDVTTENRDESLEKENRDKSSETDISLSEGKKSGKGKKAAAFVPPTDRELVEYAVSNGILSEKDALFCFNYYDSQNWKKANGQKVSNWKGCVRTWGRGERRAGGARYVPPPNPNVIIPSFDYSEDEKYCL